MSINYYNDYMDKNDDYTVPISTQINNSSIVEGILGVEVVGNISKSESGSYEDSYSSDITTDITTKPPQGEDRKSGRRVKRRMLRSILLKSLRSSYN